LAGRPLSQAWLGRLKSCAVGVDPHDMRHQSAAGIGLGLAVIAGVGVTALVTAGPAHHAAVKAGSTSWCRTGWSCVASTSAKLRLTVAAPDAAGSADFINSSIITDRGLAYSYRLAGATDAVNVFAVPAGSMAARGEPGADPTRVVVRGHPGQWFRDQTQDVLTWREAGVRYDAWFPSDVSEHAAITETNGWVAS
jgi:hypothetical protein